MLKRIIKSTPIFKFFYQKLNNQYERDIFVVEELNKIAPGSLILDAGSGNQRYRKFCNHLTYKSQDFLKYKTDDKKSIGTDGLGGKKGYDYGDVDYIGDIWSIEENDNTFDSILCTEVFEHIPYPIQTVKEFSRLLKKNGTLILTAPSNCLRHMDPYFFYSGFSDRWFKKILEENGFAIENIVPIGDYYSYLSVEIARTAISHSIFSKIMLIPSFVYFFTKKKTQISVDTLCMGYHVVAKKI